MQTFECRGEWWLPDNPDLPIPGVLTYRPASRPRLELFGSFADDVFSGAGAKYPVVLGMSTSGVAITLDGCMAVSTQSQATPLGCVETQTLDAIAALMGWHFHAPAEMQVPSFRATFAHLADWADDGNIESERHVDGDGRTRYTFVYTDRAAVRASLTDGTVSIEHNVQGTVTRPLRLSFSETHALEVTLHQPTTLRDCWIRFVYPLRTFLTLAVGYHCPLTLFQFMSPEFEHSGKKRQLPVHVLRKQLGRDGKEGYITHHEMLFSLSDIEAEFEMVLRRWFEVNKDLEPVCELYFTVEVEPDMFVRQQFLSLAQAAESYHRLRIRRYKAGKGGKNTEVTFKERIEELLDLSAEPISRLVTDKPRFATVVKDTRNYLTHNDPSTKRNAVDDNGQFSLTRVLKFLLQDCFLRELGFTSERRKEVLQRQSAYQFAAEDSAW